MSGPAQRPYLVSAGSIVALDEYFIMGEARGSSEGWVRLALMALLREREFEALHAVKDGMLLGYRRAMWEPYPLTTPGRRVLVKPGGMPPFDLFGVKPRILRAFSPADRALSAVGLELVLRLHDDLRRGPSVLRIAAEFPALWTVTSLAYVIRRLQLDGASDVRAEPLRTWLARAQSLPEGQGSDGAMWAWKVIADAEERHTDLAIELRRRGEPGFVQRQEVARRVDARLARPVVPRTEVPPACRRLASWARRLGYGDDARRTAAIGRLSESERLLVVSEFRQASAFVDSWLATQRSAQNGLSGAAEAFFWLREAEEEIRVGARSATRIRASGRPHIRRDS